jgi:hypothetical protein
MTENMSRAGATEEQSARRIYVPQGNAANAARGRVRKDLLVAPALNEPPMHCKTSADRGTQVGKLAKNRREKETDYRTSFAHGLHADGNKHLFDFCA